MGILAVSLIAIGMLFAVRGSKIFQQAISQAMQAAPNDGFSGGGGSGDSGGGGASGFGSDTGSSPAMSSHAHHVTDTDVVGATFYTQGPTWCFQSPTCQHLGTDFLAAQGSNVYAPYDMDVIALGEYPPGPMEGKYVVGTLDTGYQYYSGHLQDTLVSTGQSVSAGTLIGHTNELNHTHVQLKDPAGNLVDFQAYWSLHG